MELWILLLIILALGFLLWRIHRKNSSMNLRKNSSMDLHFYDRDKDDENDSWDSSSSDGSSED
ncbi:hypothetical protein [Thermocrinis sp.]